MLRLGLAQQRRSLFGSIPCSSQQDHYKVLGLAQSATQKDIKSAYYALSKRHHPDTNPTDKEEAAKKFHQVKIDLNGVFGVLMRKNSFASVEFSITTFFFSNFIDFQ
uniref:J domain-containing protein n=2 Tax=Caenorhabditis japonica TaxID=281687 RepID=A0A8R1ILF8_CAEJA